MILKVTVSQEGFDRVQGFLKSDANRVSRGSFARPSITNIETLVRGKFDFGFEPRGHYNQFVPIVRLIRSEGFQYSDTCQENSKDGFHLTLEIAEAIRIYFGDVMEVPANSRLLISHALKELALGICEAFEISD